MSEVSGSVYCDAYAIKKAKKIVNKHRAKVRLVRACEEDVITFRAKSLLNGARTRAKQKGIKCTLTLEWIKQKLKNGRCEVTNLPFVFTIYTLSKALTERSYTTNPFAPSLDQIKPSQGYTKDNVQVVLSCFNKFKSDTPQYLLYKVAKAYVKERQRLNGFRIQL